MYSPIHIAHAGSQTFLAMISFWDFWVSIPRENPPGRLYRCIYRGYSQSLIAVPCEDPMTPPGRISCQSAQARIELHNWGYEHSIVKGYDTTNLHDCMLNSSIYPYMQELAGLLTPGTRTLHHADIGGNKHFLTRSDSQNKVFFSNIYSLFYDLANTLFPNPTKAIFFTLPPKPSSPPYGGGGGDSQKLMVRPLCLESYWHNDNLSKVISVYVANICVRNDRPSRLYQCNTHLQRRDMHIARISGKYSPLCTLSVCVCSFALQTSAAMINDVVLTLQMLCYSASHRGVQIPPRSDSTAQPNPMVAVIVRQNTISHFMWLMRLTMYHVTCSKSEVAGI